jgi:hypothetical protein
MLMQTSLQHAGDVVKKQLELLPPDERLRKLVLEISFALRQIVAASPHPEVAEISPHLTVYLPALEEMAGATDRIPLGAESENIHPSDILLMKAKPH